MTELALPITDVELCAESAPRKLSALAREIAILGLLLATLQIADGILTAVGVSYFGTSIEGNFVLRSLMDSFGVVATLIGVKIAAIAIIMALCHLAFTVTWLRSALKLVISLYFFAAILPWSYILYNATF